MQTQRERSGGDRLGHEDNEVRAAVRFAVLAAVAGLAFLVVAALWASTCKGAMAIDTVACGAPQLTILALGAPLILLAAGCRAFLRTYRIWRNHGTWWAWQGAGWFLLMLMLVTLTMGVPSIAGPVLAG
ncbi:MAG TPA: hypothetical protein VEI45_24850 [Mycobacterium sp.]|uniref:hypothetical protein n=1 Tax=Mycobacterium sp. TaxID=1785 RepID=UPI002D685116|nr:hypothetical protein [Mycobacterium sp.]HXY67508.1 hypothetical protein [Mycobacterium sp.]